MIYTLPTKRGIGLQLWGTFDDLNDLYEVIGHFWGNESFKRLKGYDNRDELISGFSYEIRHAYQGDRLKRKRSHFSSEKNRYYGAQFSWVHILFSLTALRYNMRLVTYSKFDLATFLTLEFCIEKSMKEFDAEGAQKLLPFIEGAIYPENEYLYQL